MTNTSIPAAETAAASRHLVFLTGFMGSGKSTIGPILANTLGYEFVDVDRLIEQKANAPVVEIFERDGEDRFRVLEEEVLKELEKRTDLVVSLGGGTIANERNYQMIHKNGLIVYLHLTPEEIVRRVQHRHDRPLLRDADGRTLPPHLLTERVRTLLEAREQFYNRADIIVPSDRTRVGAMVDEIVRRLKGHL